MELQLEGSVTGNMFCRWSNYVADTKTGLRRIMDRSTATAEEYGMKINTKKTNVFVKVNQGNWP